MCLIVFSFQPGSATPLVVAANRDEFYRRKAQPLDWWPGGKILAGRDLGYGGSLRHLLSRITGKALPEYGTWLGVTRNGRFAALTNFRDATEGARSAAAKEGIVAADRDAMEGVKSAAARPREENTGLKSRGLLVSQFLEGDISPHGYAAELAQSADRYNGYNLIFGNRTELYYFSNRSGKPAAQLLPGIYGVSNALLDTPWFKLTRTKTGFASLLPNPDTKQLWELMADETRAADGEVQLTGLDFKLEKALSPAFIRLPGYGTRVTSFISFSGTGDVSFKERTFRQGKFAHDREVCFSLVP